MIRQGPITGLTVAGAVLAAAGCAGGPTASPREPAPLATPAGITRTTHVRAAILPLGSVPYDNLSLPIVSPDGRFIATQTGVSPTWPTALAEPGATVPQATHIEIYLLDRQLGRAVYHATIDEPLVLGRSCDAQGFLVESARPDGARWIGYVTWYDATIEWLVADEYVNAFACLGSGGRLAWSRRARDADHFDLVVRAGGEEWTIGSQGGGWLFPVWSGHGDELFALRLLDGTLSAAYMIATDPVSIRQSLRQLPLRSDATVYHAYQAMASQVVVADSPRSGPAQLVFFHPDPAWLRMAVWRPVSPHPRSPLLLRDQSSAALVDGSDLALVATGDHLILQNLADLRDQRPLLAGMQVPRRVASSDWPYVLMSPTEGRIGLMAMRLLRGGELRQR